MYKNGVISIMTIPPITSIKTDTFEPVVIDSKIYSSHIPAIALKILAKDHIKTAAFTAASFYPNTLVLIGLPLKMPPIYTIIKATMMGANKFNQIS